MKKNIKYIYMIILIVSCLIIIGFIYSSKIHSTEVSSLILAEQNITAKPNEEFDVVVRADVNSCYAIDGVFYYDNNLQLINVKVKSEFVRATVPSVDKENGQLTEGEHQYNSSCKAFVFNWCIGMSENNISDEPVTGQFDVAVLTFKVSENAQAGDKYNLTWDDSGINGVYIDKKVTIPKTINSQVTIVEGETEQPATPTNVKVVLNPSEQITVKQGETKQFSATVTGDNLTDKSVTWSIEGAKSTNTKIGTDGNLTIGSNETAEKITVKAVSLADNKAVATTTVSIEKKEVEQPPVENPPTPTNVSVKIEPSEVSVKQGESTNFKATVTGENLTDKSVKWSIEGAKSSNTKISTEGKLIVGSDETAEKITVKAVSVAVNTTVATATVSIQKKEVEQPPVENPPTPTNISVKIEPSEVSVKQGESTSFAATVTGDNLTDKSVKWSVQGAKSNNTKITNKGKLTIGSDETATKITVKAIAVADNTASATATVVVNKKTVTSGNANSNQTNNNQKPSNNNQGNTTDENIPSTGSNAVLIAIACVSILGIVSIVSYKKIKV